MRWRRVLGWTAGLVAASMAGGCLAVAAGAAAGVAGYAYANGKLEAAREVPLVRGFDATMSAMEDLGYLVKQARHDALEARVVAEEADGTDITIRLRRGGDDLTNFSIRVGVFGDESKSRMIMEAIDKRL